MPPIARPHLLSALLAVTALVVGVGAAPAQAAAPAAVDRSVATDVPDSQVGRQMQWFPEASSRLPLSEQELRAHFSRRRSS